MKENDDIRKTAELCGVRLWQIAKKLQMHEATFSRKLRNELSVDEKAKIFAAINSIKTERESIFSEIVDSSRISAN